MHRDVKLSCRNIWKVHGPSPDQFFATDVARDGADALAIRMREGRHIPAAIGVGFDVHVGGTFVIMGLSGSGKSTVVRCLSRLIDPDNGQVLLDGADLLAKTSRQMIDIRRHKIGMVFQNFGLLPHLNVIDNSAFPLKLQGLPAAQQRERAAHVIDLVGLTGRENACPRQLSVGQQQRVGIARSLAVKPELWLLDEPFSTLDPLIRRQMQDEFLCIQRVLRKSIVFITHDFMKALRIADRMAIMRDGKIVQIGTPEELILNPVDDYVAQFTDEVPRIKILRAGQCAEPIANRPERMPRVDPDTRVGGMLKLLAEHPIGIDVIGEGGDYFGTVTATTLIRTLAKSETAYE